MEKKAVELSACRLHQVRTVQVGNSPPGPVLWNLVNWILAPTFFLELGEWVQVAAEASISLRGGLPGPPGEHSPRPALGVTALLWWGGHGPALGEGSRPRSGGSRPRSGKRVTAPF